MTRWHASTARGLNRTVQLVLAQVQTFQVGQQAELRRNGACEKQ